ncbi:MAG TPA: bifunctional methylenetetrahydrofolate dehydrogenase/methenyltetrahydrofolate cyclohydrolase FolD [Bryobacteraceae bacterium]|jgi:methylenetetrahydrofolate dehydrogenase (NADP+)/methenyltetrahydrofolate cyclohydrolase|nr:bifunctional methylenetetrahydrofolate dehydrogenase/methenyltetrahydrofolate cyclohydrolase FolD [Bryobacteraceae bacterium]
MSSKEPAPIVLDGKWVRDEIFRDLKPRIEKVTASHRAPGLAVILVGNDPGSEIYVRLKIKTCGELGIYSEKITRPDSVTTSELLGIIEGLNERPEIDGILVQTPLPPLVDKNRVLRAVRPDKDVDGFHPINVGALVENLPGPRACTPMGILEMLRRYNLPIAGRHAVVAGRSDIVGKPMALLLLHADATVTICHSKTLDLAEECRRADILVAAIGKAHLITRNHVRPGAVIIDVGMNRKPDGKLAGDVTDDAKAIASAYTPVPGGVGPLTIAMLMANTVELAEQHLCSSR